MSATEDPAPLRSPCPDRPMRVVVFASGGGGNLRAALDVARQQPDLVSVGAVVTDRAGIPAISIARAAGVCVLVRDFEAACGRWQDCRGDPVAAAGYRQRAVRFHDGILTDLTRMERAVGLEFDLAVLSYRRWIHGALLDRFRDRMINQHAGDLTVLAGGARSYVGIDPVGMALAAGERRTRTSTIMVGDGHDTGEILCQGPWVTYHGVDVTPALATKHELRQKERSDWPSLRFALRAIAAGRLAVGSVPVHPDGSRRVYLDDQPLPHGGVSVKGEIE